MEDTIKQQFLKDGEEIREMLGTSAEGYEVTRAYKTHDDVRTGEVVWISWESESTYKNITMSVHAENIQNLKAKLPKYEFSSIRFETYLEKESGKIRSKIQYCFGKEYFKEGGEQ